LRDRRRLGTVGRVAVAQGGFPADAFDRLAALEPGNYWFEARNRLIVWAMTRYFPNSTTFLEVGCGTGFVLEGLHAAMPQLQLTATDAAARGLEIARARVPSASFVQQDARDLDVPGQFDAAGAFDVLEHIHEDADVLARVGRAVRPGGGVLITVPQHPWLWSRADDYGHHVRRYRRSELIARLRGAGLDVIRVTSFVSLLLPVLAISRRRDARRTGPFDYREFAVPGTVNMALRSVLAIERWSIRAGLSWPAGGSLLAIARRPSAS
jgi:SAM-dependent methyltransferase